MADDRSSADLSTVDTRRLEEWAFGRQGADADPLRAEAAGRELARRAQAARAARADEATARATTRGEADALADDDLDPEHPASSERPPPPTHRHRMLLTGIAGLAAAALGLAAIPVALSQPDPDPLAIFEGDRTREDRDWETRLTQNSVTAVTLGPRSIEVADGLTVIAFRAAAVVDGRSTEYDPYCLFTAEGASGSPSAFGGSCTVPERFASEGIVLPIAPSASGEGFDTVIWGPTGAPRLETGRELDGIGAGESVLDWMAFPVLASGGGDPLALVSEPDRLVLGPSVLPVYSPDDDSRAITTSIFLLDGESVETGPVFCVQASFAVDDTTTTCALLSAVRRDGLAFSVIGEGREWEVRIDADGPTRRDSVRAVG